MGTGLSFSLVISGKGESPFNIQRGAGHKDLPELSFRSRLNGENEHIWPLRANSDV